MKKEDLKNGMIVEVKTGRRYLVLNDEIIRVDGREPIKNYSDNLTHKNVSKYDIVKIYEFKNHYTLTDIFNDYALQLIWQRPTIKLTDDEKTILRNVPKEFNYIARDGDDTLGIYVIKPLKNDYEWRIGGINTYKYMGVFQHLFSCIKWSDDEPFNFREYLNNLDKGGDK